MSKLKDYFTSVLANKVALAGYAGLIASPIVVNVLEANESLLGDNYALTQLMLVIAPWLVLGVGEFGTGTYDAFRTSRKTIKENDMEKLERYLNRNFGYCVRKGVQLALKEAGRQETVRYCHQTNKYLIENRQEDSLETTLEEN